MTQLNKPQSNKVTCLVMQEDRPSFNALQQAKLAVEL